MFAFFICMKLLQMNFSRYNKNLTDYYHLFVNFLHSSINDKSLRKTK